MSELEPAERKLLSEQCFKIDMCFGQAAQTANLLIYFHVSSILRSLIRLHGLRLEDVELREVPLALAWRPAAANERTAGRVGSIEVDVTLVFQSTTLRLELSSLGT
eukprot:5550337-Prymnesium_polylepis.1